VEQALQTILEDSRWAQGDTTTFDGFCHSVDNVRALLENVRPYVVQQVGQRIFTAKSSYAQRLTYQSTHTQKSGVQLAVDAPAPMHGGSKLRGAAYQVFHGGCRRLSMHQIAVHQRILEKWGDSVHVVLKQRGGCQQTFRSQSD
jgi:hypothetical protein